MASMSSASASNFDELRWVINIHRSLSEEPEEEEETEFLVSIFNVPKTLMSTDPESYIPQLVAIGPYHYNHPDLHEMERYKLAAAKTIQKHLHCDLKFHTLVENLMRFEPRIRACYHKYLHFNGETLAWMMAIDASFLLEFLQIFGTQSSTISSRMSHLVVSILRDIVMLENQIPLFILRTVLEIRTNSTESADELLISMLNGLFKELSPLKYSMSSDLPKIDITKCAHVLDYLHDMIVPKVDEERQYETNEPEEDHKTSESRAPSCLTQLHVVSKLKALLVSRPVRVILNNFLPLFPILKQLIEHSFYQEEDVERKPENSPCSGPNKPPLAEEIAIPSVVELYKSGVRFIPTDGNISTVKFDTENATFHLPTVTLDINTKVVLRNLVAYEASNASGRPLVLARYTELMNGIIDTGEDVRLLSESGIIMNHLKSDEEGAELWNGMSKSIRLTKVALLDKVIEDVNKYYNGRLNVKAREFFKRYVYGSWQLLTLLAATLLLILLTFQAFSSLYSCSRLTY